MSKKLGPWKVQSVCRLGEIECANGFQIMDGDDCLVEMLEGNGWNKTQMLRILNMMAAAPQMYEALVTAADYLAEFFEEGRANRVVKLADAAIAKANGRSRKKPKMKVFIEAAEQMKRDVDAFLAHMDKCGSKDEAAEIARDMTALLRESSAKVGEAL